MMTKRQYCEMVVLNRAIELKDKNCKVEDLDIEETEKVALALQFLGYFDENTEYNKAMKEFLEQNDGLIGRYYDPIKSEVFILTFKEFLDMLPDDEFKHDKKFFNNIEKEYNINITGGIIK